MMRRLDALVALLIILGATFSIPHAGAQASVPGFVQHSDGRGDVAVSAAGQPGTGGLPENDATGYFDITEFSLTDLDEETLVIRLKVASGFRSVFQTGGYGSLSAEEILHHVRFTIPGVGGTPVLVQLEARSVRVRIENQTDAKTELMVQTVQVCFPTGTQVACDFWSYSLEKSLENGALVMKLRKELLTQAYAEQGYGSQRTRANLPARLVPGDALTDLFARTLYRPVYSFGGLVEPVRFSDRAPNTGALQLALAYGTPAVDLRMTLSWRAVIRGVENDVPVLVQNLGTHKRIVNFTAEMLPAGDAKPWPLEITPSATLGAGKSTNITLRVKPPAEGPEAALYRTVKLRATILTEPGTIAIERVSLVASPPLDREYSTFYVHGEDFPAWPEPIPIRYGHGILSRDETDSDWSDVPFPMDPRGFGTGAGLFASFSKSFNSREAPNPATIRPGEPVVGAIEVMMPTAATATVRALFTYGPQTVAQFEKTGPLVAGKNKIDVQAPILGSFQRMDPANGTLRVDVRLEIPMPDAAPYLTGFFRVIVPEIVPKTSYFRFPLDREFPAVESGSKLKVVLAAAEELESFVNPGRVQVFELDLRNEEPAPMTVELAALNVTEGWNVEIRPGTRYRLASNDSVHIGVVVGAPLSAKEGDAVRFRVVVREILNETLISGQWIRAIATRGVDIENETFEVAADDAKKLATGDGKSSSLAFLAAVSVVVALAVLRKQKFS